MKDVSGMPVKEGNFIQVKLGNEWIVGVVHKIEDGGMVIPINPTQKGVTPEKLFVIFEVNMLDAAPGQNHPTLRRLCHPDKEIIVPINIKEH
jgi:hypothetical protein